MKTWELNHLFFNFFQSLRKELGMELDLRQYALFVEALSRGIGAGKTGQYDKQNLLQLCKTLWLTHARFEPAFEKRFRRFADQYSALFYTEREKPTPEKPSKAAESQTPKLEVSTPEPPEVQQTPPAPAGGIPPTAAPQPGPAKDADWKELMVSFEPLATGEDRPPFTTGGEYSPLPDHRFVFADKYFPVGERRLQHYWRHLRHKAEKRPGTAIDLPATLGLSARQCGLPQIVFQQERFFEEHFLFLLDREGSMTAFEKLSDLFLKAVRESIRPDFMETYYFHDLPGNLLYRNPSLTESTPQADALRNLTRHTLVFIISDGGAARGAKDDDRAGDMLDWLQKLKERTSHILWLNPVPRSRWPGNPAFYIPFVTQTLELTADSLTRLPHLLRHL